MNNVAAAHHHTYQMARLKIFAFRLIVLTAMIMIGVVIRDIEGFAAALWIAFYVFFITVGITQIRRLKVVATTALARYKAYNNEVEM